MDDIDAPCLDRDQPCEVCQHGDYRRCPVRLDQEYRSYLLAVRANQHLREQEAELRRHRVFEIVRKHRLPLHYQMVHRIYARQYKDNPISDHAVYAILSTDPEIEALGDGVYRISRAHG